MNFKPPELEPGGSNDHPPQLSFRRIPYRITRIRHVQLQRFRGLDRDQSDTGTTHSPLNYRYILFSPGICIRPAYLKLIILSVLQHAVSDRNQARQSESTPPRSYKNQADRLTYYNYTGRLCLPTIRYASTFYFLSDSQVKSILITHNSLWQ